MNSKTEFNYKQKSKVKTIKTDKNLREMSEKVSLIC